MRPLRKVPVVMTVARAWMMRLSRRRIPVMWESSKMTSDFGLLDVEVRLRLEDFAHFYAVLLLVALRSGRPYGGAARGVEEAKLDPDGVRYFAHDAAESVDFANKMAFGDASDGGVAGHLGDEIEVEREQRGAQAHAGRSHGGFAAGVSSPHDDYVVLFGKRHPFYFSEQAIGT